MCGPEHGSAWTLPNMPPLQQRGPSLLGTPRGSSGSPRTDMSTSVSHDVCLSLFATAGPHVGTRSVSVNHQLPIGVHSDGTHPGILGPPPIQARPTAVVSRAGPRPQTLVFLCSGKLRARPTGGRSPGGAGAAPPAAEGPASPLPPPLSPGAPEGKVGLRAIYMLFS